MCDFGNEFPFDKLEVRPLISSNELGVWKHLLGPPMEFFEMKFPFDNMGCCGAMSLIFGSSAAVTVRI